ncbi:DUF1754-domain-containing protein [Dioszegia hungarica]|uniref:DUF1754-domain-containing protein n=1 Tax=Dioszegia hungarica TaxID=4972 RepID=A0AA38LWP0_9TREE|nr:DUF1754-domain-containing protein [Dioszegia hungarica]KAI9636899.1 DUF1754-domain-containing protein [Dioszegia hungarica]
MSDYAVIPGGSLKFKGGDLKKKKKKSSSHTTSEKKPESASIAESSKAREKKRDDEETDTERRKRAKVDSDDEGDKEEAMKPKSSGGRQMTDAERKFEEIQRKRRHERVAKTANMSHKDRVTEFNSKLDKLTEHNDIPKISWTG